SMAIKLKKSGQTYAEVSKTIDVHPSTICAWLKHTKGMVKQP
ncbi:MAG: helix-turn-helix domain-containing protein, partial [Desulfobacteraceae bacterium]|nr:helix-turn-helix domain-containing protein [Desulfobacteraceae bacterium]